MILLAQDSFVRANQTGFGISSDGETWTETGTGTTSLASNTGVIVSLNADTSMQLGTLTSIDQDVLCLVTFNFLADIGGVQARYSVSGGNITTYKFLYYTGGFHLNKMVGGAATNIANFSTSITAGSSYWMRLKCVGTSLFARYWQQGNTEPTAWILTATDSSIASGGFAVLANTTTGSGGVQFSSLTVTNAHTPLDTLSRTRLAAQQSRSSLVRALLLSQRSRFISLRLAMKATNQFFLPARLRLQAIQTRLIASRLLLRGSSLPSFGVRVRTLASTLRTLSGRVRVMNLRILSSVIRSRLLGSRLASFATRLIVAVMRTGDIGSRLSLVLQQVMTIGLRSLFSAQSFSDVTGRILLFSGMVHDLLVRLTLVPTHSLSFGTRGRFTDVRTSVFAVRLFLSLFLVFRSIVARVVVVPVLQVGTPLRLLFVQVGMQRTLRGRILVFGVPVRTILTRLRLLPQRLLLFPIRLVMFAPGITQSLILYYTNTVSSLLSSASQLYINTGTTPTTNATYTNFGSGTGFIELMSQGQIGLCQPTIGAPSGQGFLLENSVLYGNKLVAGTWSGVIRLNASQYIPTTGTGFTQAGTLTADLFVRVYKLSLATGTYTPIVTMTLPAQSLTLNFTSYTFSGVSASQVTFSPITNDVVYIDCWAKITANTNTSANQGIRFNRLSSDTTGLTGDPAAEVVTPGYTSDIILLLRTALARVRLQAIHLLSVVARFRLSVTQSKDTSARARLIVGTVVQSLLQMRVSLLSTLKRDTPARMRLIGLAQRTLSARTNLLLTFLGQRTLHIRTILVPSFLRIMALAGRMRLIASGKPNWMMRAVVLVYTPTPVLPPSPPSLSGASMLGQVALVPRGVYQLGGIALDIPLACTAPLAATGLFVPTGSTFTLLFQHPSAQTLTALSSFTQAQMTFALQSGELVTGPVSLVTQQFNASSYSVTIMTLADIWVQRWVIASQFP